MTWLVRVLAVLIVLGSVARAVTVIWPPVKIPVQPRAQDRQRLQRLLADQHTAIWELNTTSVDLVDQSDRDPMWQALAALGVDRIECHRFDPTATVVLVPGPDGAPGRVDWDDDGNGVIDDRSEFGATGSDDRVLVRGEADSKDELTESLTLQRGAYRPSNFTARPAQPSHPVRLWIHR